MVAAIKTAADERQISSNVGRKRRFDSFRKLSAGLVYICQCGPRWGKKKSNSGDNKKQQHPPFSIFLCDHEAHAGTHERFCRIAFQICLHLQQALWLDKTLKSFQVTRIPVGVTGWDHVFDCCCIPLASTAKMRCDKS